MKKTIQDSLSDLNEIMINAEKLATDLSDSIIDIAAAAGKVQQHHYFCSSAAGWAVHEDIVKCLEMQEKEDKEQGMRGCGVFHVPVPVNQHYLIKVYQPEVKGLVYIGFHEYDKPKEITDEEKIDFILEKMEVWDYNTVLEWAIFERRDELQRNGSVEIDEQYRELQE